MFTIEHFQNVPDLLEAASSWPLELEAISNFPLSLAMRLDKAATDIPYLATIRRDGETCALAVVTPRELLLSGLPEDAAQILANDLAGHVESLPGVVGPTVGTTRFAEAWAELKGVEAKVGMDNLFYVLGTLRPPARMPGGETRLATTDDQELIAHWLVGFIRDADLPPADYQSEARRLIATDELLLWLDPEPVSMAAVCGRTPRGGRIGYVYTPPDLRGRGYGAAATFAVTEGAVEAGAGYCSLLADLHNPLTNRLYQRLGFERRHEEIEFLFT